MALVPRNALARLVSVGGQSLRRVSPTPGVSRAFSTTPRASSQHWQQRGIIGSNLPFDISNRYKLTAYFIVFFGTAFNLPFWVVYHQVTKK